MALAPGAAAAWAAQALAGSTLRCLYVLADAADSRGTGETAVAASASGAALLAALHTGVPVAAAPGALTGAAVQALQAASSLGGFALSLSAAVPPPGSSGAAWALSQPAVDCVLPPAPLALRAGQASSIATAAYTPVTPLLVTTPNAAGPRVFTLPLAAWTSPFAWQLWAVLGGFVVAGVAVHGALGRRRGLGLLLARRVHAASWAFVAVLLCCAYLAALLRLERGPGWGASPPTSLCVLGLGGSWAAAAFPAAAPVLQPSAAALVYALRTGACSAALASNAELAAVGGCSALTRAGWTVQLLRAQAQALSLSDAWAANAGGDAARALEVLLLPQAVGGDWDECRSAAAPAGGSTTLRSLSSLFLLYGAALLLTFALLLVQAFAGRRARRRASSASTGGGVDDILRAVNVDYELGKRPWRRCFAAAEAAAGDGRSPPQPTPVLADAGLTSRAAALASLSDEAWREQPGGREPAAGREQAATLQPAAAPPPPPAAFAAPPPAAAIEPPPPPPARHRRPPVAMPPPEPDEEAGEEEDGLGWPLSQPPETIAERARNVQLARLRAELHAVEAEAQAAAARRRIVPRSAPTSTVGRAPPLRPILHAHDTRL